MLGYFFDIADVDVPALSRRPARVARRAARSHRRAPGRARHAGQLEAALALARLQSSHLGGAPARGAGDGGRRPRQRHARGVRPVARHRPARVRGARRAVARAGGGHRARGGRTGFDRASGPHADRRSPRRRCTRPASTRSRCTTPITTPPTVARYAAMAADLGLLVTGGSDFHDPASALRPGRGDAARGDWERLRARRRSQQPRAMSATSEPLLQLRDVTQDYGGLRPLRVKAFDAARGPAASRFSASIRVRPKCW